MSSKIEIYDQKRKKYRGSFILREIGTDCENMKMINRHYHANPFTKLKKFTTQFPN